MKQRKRASAGPLKNTDKMERKETRIRQLQKLLVLLANGRPSKPYGMT